MKKRKNEIMDNIKDTVGIGLSSSMGIGLIGGIGNMVPGGAASGAMKLSQASLNLANVAQLAKTGNMLTKQMRRRK